MATCHRGAGCPVDRNINLHIEDTEGINTGPDNDNEIQMAQTLPLPLED